MVLYEILKNYPKGAALYSTAFGWVYFEGTDEANSIIVTDEDGEQHIFNSNGKLSKYGQTLLFPSTIESWDLWYMILCEDEDYVKCADGKICKFKTINPNFTKIVGFASPEEIEKCEHELICSEG